MGVKPDRLSCFLNWTLSFTCFSLGSMDLFYVLSYGAIERILELRTEDLEQYYARARR
jgi:hypothetical protein